MNMKRLSEFAIIFLALVVLLFLLIEFKSLLMPLAFSVILAFLFTPYLRLNKKNKVKKVTKFIGIVILMIGAFTLAFTTFAYGVKDINLSLDGSTLLNLGSVSIGGLDLNFSDYLTFNSTTSSDIFVHLLGALTSFFSTLFTVLIFLLFVLPALNGLIKTALEHKSEKVHSEFLKTIYDLELAIEQYLSVKTLISFLTGLVSLVILLLFGVKFAFVFAVIIFLFNFVPTFGSIAAVGVVLIFELLTSGFSISFLMLSLLLILVQLVMGNIFEPKLTGRKLNISALMVIISLFFWGYIWGVGGMFFSVPLTISCMIIGKHILRSKL